MLGVIKEDTRSLCCGSYGQCRPEKIEYDFFFDYTLGIRDCDNRHAEKQASK